MREFVCVCVNSPYPCIDRVGGLIEMESIKKEMKEKTLFDMLLLENLREMNFSLETKSS